MFAKISDFIKPLFKGDAVSPHPKGPGQDGKKKSRHEQEDFGEEDTTFFSIEAIRAMLKQEPGDVLTIEALLSSLDLMQQQGITSLPVAPGQSVVAAVTAAAVFLRQK